MKTFIVKAPNKKEYEIDGPDDASPEEIRTQLLAKYPEAERPTDAQLAMEKEVAAIKARGGLPEDDTLGGNVFRGIGKTASDWGLARGRRQQQ
jgi:hypothetical protein